MATASFFALLFQAHNRACLGRCRGEGAHRQQLEGRRRTSLVDELQTQNSSFVFCAWEKRTHLRGNGEGGGGGEKEGGSRDPCPPKKPGADWTVASFFFFLAQAHRHRAHGSSIKVPASVLMHVTGRCGCPRAWDDGGAGVRPRRVKGCLVLSGGGGGFGDGWFCCCWW